MGAEVTALLAALVSIGTLLVGYLGLRSRASGGFVDDLAERLNLVEEGLRLCEARERDLSRKLVDAYKLAAEEVRRSAVIEAEANVLRRHLIEARKCPIAAKGECPPESS